MRPLPKILVELEFWGYQKCLVCACVFFFSIKVLGQLSTGKIHTSLYDIELAPSYWSFRDIILAHPCASSPQLFPTLTLTKLDILLRMMTNGVEAEGAIYTGTVCLLSVISKVTLKSHNPKRKPLLRLLSLAPFYRWGNRLREIVASTQGPRASEKWNESSNPGICSSNTFSTRSFNFWPLLIPMCKKVHANIWRPQY